MLLDENNFCYSVLSNQRRPNSTRTLLPKDWIELVAQEIIKKMAERKSTNFWNKQELSTFEPGWFTKVQEGQLNFSADGELDEHAERTIGNRLMLSGPLVDSFLEEIGK